MKKLIGNKYLLILNLVLLLIGGSLLIYKNNELKSYKEEISAPDVDSNYDKLKVVSVSIKERKTGLPTFNSVSDMDGHDASADDNYVRTFDSVTYIVEVGIDKNPYTTTEDEIIKGGKIKVRVKIPTSDGTYLMIIRDSWMQNYTLNNNWTEITTSYDIPSDKLPAGGTQQLSFTLRVLGNEKVLDESLTPIFEVWMDGNKPDNENSQIDKIVVQDPNPIIITGALDANLSFAKGKVNVGSELNGVKGQYINFFTRIYTGDGKGKSNAQNELSSTLKIEYSYRNLDDPNGEMINIATINQDDPINGTTLYSYGRPGETTPGFWPDSEKNTNSSNSYYAKRDSSVTSGNVSYKYIYDSGVMSANQDGANINFSNEGFYSYVSIDSLSYKTIAAQGFELFVPWYEPTPGRYEYQIKITDTSLTVEDENGEKHTSNPNKSITFTFYNNLTGNASYYFTGAGSDVFNDVTDIPIGDRKTFFSYIFIEDGPYEGGLERLEVWNSNYVEFESYSSYPYIYYSNSGAMPSPSTSNAQIKYGIYKANPDVGTNTDALVNAALIEDFDWYDTYQEAQKYGKITALRTIEPDWRGYNVTSYLYTYLKPINDLSAVGKTGIIRMKAYLYGDAEKTQVYKIGENTNYIGAVIKEDGSGLQSSPNPTALGQTYLISGLTLGISTENTDKVNNIRKTNYNVEDEIVNMSITPSFYSSMEEMTGTATFKVEASIPANLSYRNNSSNYEPKSITTNSSGGTSVVWEFTNWNLADPLPVIKYKLEISPYAANNSQKTVYAYLSSPSVLGGRKSYTTSFTLTNLAGSSLRKILEKEVVERDEALLVNDFIYNIAQAHLLEFKTVEILPKNGDNFGTNYSGSYILEVISLADTQTMYYTTNSIDNIGLTADPLGRMNIQNVDLANDSRWHEIHVGDTIPSNATAIATYIPDISPVDDVNYKLNFKPTGNTYNDVYYFQFIGSSANLENAVSSSLKQLTVVDREINGIVFLDNNHNGKYESNKDQLLSNKTVKMYDEDNNLVREMTTDENGHYESVHFEKGNYYIQYDLDANMEFVEKNAGASNISSVINKNTGKSDIIQELSQNPTTASVVAANKNIGVQYKQAQVITHHYLVGTTTKVHDDVTENTYFNSNYSTTSIASGDLYDEYANKYRVASTTGGDPVSGTVNKGTVEVIYYYEQKSGQVIAHHYLVGTTTKVHDDVVQSLRYGEQYTTERLSLSSYVEAGVGGDPVSGTVNKDAIEVIYYYRLKTSVLTVHHYVEGTTTKVHSDDTYNKLYTQTYETKYYESNELEGNYKNNYRYKSRTGDEATGTINKDSYEIIYYYELKPATVTVHHYVEGTTTKVHSDDTYNKLYTQTYETNYYESNELEGNYKNNYRYKNRSGDNATGTINKDSYEIIYYYELKPATVTVHHYVEGTTNKVHSDDTYNKKYTETYETNYYESNELEGNYKNNYRYKSRTGDNATGTINKDSYEIIYYYELKPATVTVHHYIKDTETKVHDDDIINKLYTENYQTNYYEDSELDANYKNNYKYNNNHSGDNISGTVNKDNYEIIYYYEPKASVITVHHYIKGTETKLHDDDIINTIYGVQYETNYYQSNELTDTNYYYNNVHGGDDSAGVINKDSYVVTYYYELRPAKVTIHHYILDTTTEVHPDDIIHTHYGETYTTNYYESLDLNLLYKGLYIYGEVHSGDDINGTVNKDSYEITYFYNLKPAQITVHHYIEDTTTKLCDDKVLDLKYTDQYEVDSCLNLSDANYTYKNVINTGSGEQTGSKITGNILEDSIEITYYYTLKPGRIVVHYIESGTDRRLIDDIIGEGLVTQEYTHESKEFEGYELVKSPESNKITFMEDTQDVFYEYEKIKYNIEVQVSGGIGEITGNEVVYYGEDSTKDYIVITPGNGYEIESLLVNGKEVGLTSRDKQTLENLKNVKENYLIQVSFREKVTPVPITDSSSKLIPIGLIFIALNLMGFFYFKFRHNN